MRRRTFLTVSGHSAPVCEPRPQSTTEKYHIFYPLKEIQFVRGIFTLIVFSCHWRHVSDRTRHSDNK